VKKEHQMTERIRPLYEVVEARKQLAETVAKGKQGFGDCGIVELNEEGTGVTITHGANSIHPSFKAAMELRDLLTSMFPKYHDSELLPPEPAPESEAAHD
jgi:hypothetical protein